MKSLSGCCAEGDSRAFLGNRLAVLPMILVFGRDGSVDGFGFSFTKEDELDEESKLAALSCKVLVKVEESGLGVVVRRRLRPFELSKEEEEEGCDFTEFIGIFEVGSMEMGSCFLEELNISERGLRAG